ncbi:BPI fold-containing family A member 1 [Desmodus rotundus]|uniref:BPI fold-containing family A member 1 n=1 Tax=Desmodus rotundus TaxID=9430 RepID=K9IHM5_DESRO|nr:BPI fold-containing family A member 1 [Desmodus rotundus]
MFQIRGLIVFCGLLALPLPVDLALSPMDLGDLTGALNNGLLSGGLLDTVKNLPLLDMLKIDGDDSRGPIGRLLEQVINPLKSLTGIEITKPKLLELGLVPSEDGHRLYLNIPLSFDLNVPMPVLKVRLLKLSVELNITVEIYPEVNENGVNLAIGDCSQPPVELKVTLLDGSETFLIQRLVNRITNVLSKAIPKLLLGTVCSAINGVLRQLDASLVHNIANKLIPEKDFIINL